MSDWPPPGYWRNPKTGEQWRATAAEEREANRLLWKHRDLAGPESNPVPVGIKDSLGAAHSHTQLDLGDQEPPE